MPVPFYMRGLYRLFQTIMFAAAAVLPWRRPHLLKGADAISKLPSFIRGKKLHHSFVVTDASIMKLGLVDGLLSQLSTEGLKVTVFKDVSPNPSVDQVEAALKAYQTSDCDHIVAFGGGSVIDCAKVVGARSVRPRTSTQKMRGLFKVLWKLPPLFAVPTTAGTGSECTVAAVVTNPSKQEKYALVDPFLVPPYAVLDPVLTVGLPPFITATTGMDALTHGIESYLSIFHGGHTAADGIRAVRLVFGNLKRAYDDGGDLMARQNMQEAAYFGGLAFTRAYVGNVHAAAHTLGGFCNIPHGYANAVILPHVLEMYGSAVYPRLAQLADAVGIMGRSDEEKARMFIEAVNELNASMGIPRKVSGEKHRFQIKPEDVPRMVQMALREVNPLYPVPVIFGVEEMTEVFKRIM